MNNILLLCGGDGSEHDVSLVSASFIYETLKDSYNIIQVIIHNDSWVTKDGEKCFIDNNKNLIYGTSSVKIDYAIPCIHGFPGETGDIQSYLELLKIPYLGCNSESSKLCFNKISTKLWLSAANIPNTEYSFINDNSKESIEKALSFFDKYNDIFIKAASQGSSVGCYKVNNRNEIEKYINDAFKYSNSILLEKSEKPRELEVAIYEYKNEIIATNPGEIITPDNNFYTFEEKYNNSSKSTTIVESNIGEDVKQLIKKYAIEAFKLFKLKDLSRIDFFITSDNKILLNEINTFPGMTPISMFPKMLEHHGENIKEFFIDRINNSINK